MPLKAWSADPERIVIDRGPYLQAVGDDEFTVCWRTNMESVGWVEVAPDDGTHFYQTERPKYYDARFGRKKIGKFHTVRITGLEPGKKYRYRVMQKSVLLDEHKTRIIYGEGFGSDILRHQPYKVATLDANKPTVKFAMGNDFHENDALVRKAFANAREKNYDFVVFNGDMTTQIENEDYMFDHYLQSASELFASDIPLYMLRGNHENRGSFAINYMDYFPSLSGAPYYGFRQGPVYFLCLDGGEDKPDNDIRNLDIMVSDQFRADELKWLRGVLDSKEFKEAPVKIVFMHMPPDGTDSGWYGVHELYEKFMPLLNEAGVDLMLSGHYHNYKWVPANTPGFNNSFPILIHDDKVLLEGEATKDVIRLTTYDKDQKVEHQHEIRVKN